LEVHPASSRHVQEVLKKLRWLREWLQNEGLPLAELPQNGFFWVATRGHVAITPHSRHAKQRAAQGLHGPVRVLRL